MSRWKDVAEALTARLNRESGHGVMCEVTKERSMHTPIHHGKMPYYVRPVGESEAMALSIMMVSF